MRLLSILSITLLSALVAPVCHAMDVATYRAGRNDPNDTIVMGFVAGVGHGYQWANADLQERGLKMLYCQPPKLALSVSNYMKILDDHLASHPEFAKVGDGGVEYALLLGLKDTFPCP